MWVAKLFQRIIGGHICERNTGRSDLAALFTMVAGRRSQRGKVTLSEAAGLAVRNQTAKRRWLWLRRNGDSRFLPATEVHR